MVNSTITEDIIDTFKLDRFVNNVPAVIPVVDVSPKNATGFVVSTSGTNTGVLPISAAMLRNVTVDDSIIYLTGVYASYIKDATCDLATGAIAVYCQPADVGQNVNIISFPVIALTAQSDSIYINFRNPIKLTKNTAVTIQGTFTAGVLVRALAVHGYRL